MRRDPLAHLGRRSRHAPSRSSAEGAPRPVRLPEVPEPPPAIENASEGILGAGKQVFCLPDEIPPDEIGAMVSEETLPAEPLRELEMGPASTALALPEPDAAAIEDAQHQAVRVETSELSSAAVYISTLQSVRSRQTAKESLGRIARVLGVRDWREIPWDRIDFATANLIRARLAETHSPGTANLTLSAVRMVARTAFLLGRMSSEEYERIRAVGAVRGSRVGKGRALTEEEIGHLKAFCESQGDAQALLWLAILAVILGAGLRREEVVHLRVGDYREESLFVIGKGNRQRRIKLASEVQVELDAWLDLRSGLEVPHDRMFVTISDNGAIRRKPMSVWALWHLLWRIGNKAEITKFTPHDLRRTHRAAVKIWGK